MRRCAILLLLLVLCGSVAAEETPQPVVIAYIADSVDHHTGRAVLEEAYERLGIPVTFRGFQADEALAASNGGEVDGELQRIDGIQHRFKNLVQVPIPLNYIQVVAFSKAYRFPILGWHSLKPYTVGIVEGIQFAERGTEGMDVRVAKTYPELMTWVDEGEVDVGVVPRISGLVALRRSTHPEVKEMQGVLETLFAYHYLHRSRADLKPRLSKVLKAMLLDGTILRLRKETHARLLGDDR